MKFNTHLHLITFLITQASYGVSLDSENIAVTAYDKENNDLQTVTLDQLPITEEWYTLEIKR